MKFTSSSLATGTLLITQALAHPLSPNAVKRQDVEMAEKPDIDTTVLQFALTLEHLENAFYKKALSDLSEQQFMDAGFDAMYYSNIQYISSDESAHVMSLTAALTEADGVDPNGPCEYDFPFTDVSSFITLSSILEGVGTSAYLGAAGLITSPEYLTVAGSILAVEALHTSLQRTSRGLIAAANPYYTPLSPSPVFTLAAAFIKPGSCPSTNTPLPFTAFPTLTAVDMGPLAMGMAATFSIPEPSDSTDHKFLTFVSGLVVASVQVEGEGTEYSAVVPMGVAGQSYVFLTSEDVSGGPGSVTDDVIINGPAIVEITPAAPEL